MRQYIWCSEYCTLHLNSPSGLTEEEANAWAEKELAALVKRPEDFWLVQPERF
jgi:hypothetical protein